MVGTYSRSILKRESPQYAYALAIFSGGIAYIAPQLGVPIAAWLSYALLALLFGSIWPDRALQWGVWLCLPIVLLVWVDVLITGGVGALLSKGMIFAKALSSACLGAYVGSKLSVRKIANRFTNRHANRERLNVYGHVAQNSLVLNEIATLTPGVKTNLSSQSAVGPVQAIESATHLHGLNAALMKAAQEGDLNKIKLLVAEGADVNAKSSDQWMSLAITTGGYDVETVKTLFGQGAMLDYSGGWTALMIATIEGHVEVVRALLEHGAEVSAENNKGWTALRFAVSMDETEILRVLLDAGADANIADHEGKTALMQAAGENIKESLKVLLDAGADPHLKDHDKQTALMIAQKQGHVETIKLLKEAEAQVHFLYDGNSKATDKTHRVIKRRHDKHYGLAGKYDVIPRGAALPYGCEETGCEGNEEECRHYAWKSNSDEPADMEWWLGLSS